jgi:hypothetical protein
MAKGKKKSSGGAVKMHGPKRKLFHEWSRSMRIHLANAGLLTKYTNYESFKLACVARGIKNPTEAMFDEMRFLKTQADKDAWFKSLRK